MLNNCENPCQPGPQTIVIRFISPLFSAQCRRWLEAVWSSQILLFETDAASKPQNRSSPIDFFDFLRILPGFPISWRILGSSPSTTTFESERLSGLLGAPQIFNSARRECGCPAPARREKNDATVAIPTTLSSYSYCSVFSSKSWGDEMGMSQTWISMISIDFHDLSGVYLFYLNKEPKLIQG